MHDKLDNFTADSLQNFIRTPPARNSILDEEMELNPDRDAARKPGTGIPRAKPRTARAERIGQILESASVGGGRPAGQQPQQPRAASPGPGPQQSTGSSGPGHHDAQVRQHMGELVRVMLQEGRTEDLAVILQSHQKFIADVLHMIQQGR